MPLLDRRVRLVTDRLHARNWRNVSSLLGIAIMVGGVANGAFLDRPKANDGLDRLLAAEVDTAAQQLDSFSNGVSIALRATARQPDLAAALRPPSSPSSPSLTAKDADARRQRVEDSLNYLQSISSLRLESLTIYTASGDAMLSTGESAITARPNDIGDRPATTSVDPLTVAAYANTHVNQAFWGAPGGITISQPLRTPGNDATIGLATPVVDADGRKVGVLEARTRLDGLRRTLSGRVYPTLLINATTGATDVDSRDSGSEKATAPNANSFVIGLPAAAVRGSLTVNERRTSWKRISTIGNENNWILAVENQRTNSLFDGLGPSTFGPLFTGVLLLVMAGVAARSERGRLEQALTDELTGLPSRRLLKDRLEQAVLHAKRSAPGAEVALMVLDLDRFKEVNDVLGHSNGDRLLVEIAGRLRAVLRENDTIARLGGDEFAVVISMSSPAGDVEVAEKLQHAFAQPVSIDGLLITVGASIGIARFPADGDDPERLLRCADVAMYNSKRNRLPWVRYAIENDPSDPARLELLSDLRLAIGTSQLELHYQPKVNLATEEVMGVEALLRWTHPTKGPIRPDTFISIAEQTGVIAPLTDDVLRKAARQLRIWMQQGRQLSVAVNISAANLTEGEFVERVRRIVTEEDAPAEYITLELTESAVMSDRRRGLEVLNELASIGFRLSIDDFGTGYSSLSYLQRLPVDELKIDRSFVKTLTEDQVNRSIVRSTVDLGHNLGLSVVAEGVEDGETLAALAELGCDCAQGYFIARPMPTDAFLRWLEDRNNDPQSGEAQDANALPKLSDVNPSAVTIELPID